jgi:UDP:flavonoid glycosyltransferase YjiC (YdhE family)
MVLTVTIAISEIYRPKVEGEGLKFHPVRPDMPFVLDGPDVMRRAFHPRTGSEYIVRELLLPWLEQTYEDTLEVARGVDLLVGHVVAFATRMVAETLNKRWLSVVLQPAVFLSVHDPPVISGARFFTPLHSLGPGLTRQLFWFARHTARRWGAPVNALRAKLGLPLLRNPLIDDMYSPWGTQAWFSKLLAQPQPDWPERTVATGFPFYDKLEAGQGLSAELARFLDAGPAPVVFTLGSSAVFDAGTFFTESFEAVRRMGCRAVLLTGRDARNVPLQAAPETIFVAEYARYSELLPRAAATVHQGGVGTTAQALRAGRPMIVVPYSHDQPDNGMRVARLGVARVIPRGRYSAARVVRELKTLLEESAYAAAAARAACEMAQEDGVKAACDGLEASLR